MKAKKVIKKDILKNKEERLLKGSLLKFGNHIQPKDLSEILYKLFYINWDIYEGRKEITYNTRGQKSGNYNARSIEDAFRISRTYIPTITYKKVDEAIKQLKEVNAIRGSFCHTCRRVVYNLTGMKAGQENITKALGKLNIKTTIK